MRMCTPMLGACCALALVAAPALAADGVARPQPPLQSQSAPQGDWISLTGTIASISGDRLALAAGDGEIEVTLSGLGAADTTMLRPGDRVGVTGRMDGSVFTDRRIAADSLYVARLNRLLGNPPPGSAAAQPRQGFAPDRPRGEEDWVIVTGRVVAMDGDDLTIESGGQRIAVDADDEGPADVRGVKVGDRVSVTGELERSGVHSRREIDARSVIVLTGSGA